MRQPSTGTGLIESTNLSVGGSGGYSQNWVEVSLNINNSVTNVAFGLFGNPDRTSREFGWDNVTLTGTVIPEPSTFTLICGSFIAMAAWSMRKRRR
jgi:hypothetical protein